MATLTKRGYVYSCGRNSYGELGGGQNQSFVSALLTKVALPLPVIRIFVGRWHSFCQTNNFYVYGFGKNSEGQLGLGDNWDRASPTVISYLKDDHTHITFALGHEISYFLSQGPDEKPTLYTAGSNDFGTLGNGAIASKSIQTEIICKEGTICLDVLSVGVGRFHTVSLANDGEMHAFGSNSYGQLGTRDRSYFSSPVRVELGMLEPNDKLVFVGGGAYHNVAISRLGLVYTWGLNSNGQLGLGDHRDRLVPTKIQIEGNFSLASASMADSAYFSMIVTNESVAWSFGDQRYGQLGLGTSSRDQIGRPTMISTLKDIISVSAGGHHTLFLVKGSHVYAVGRNQYGQLGLGQMNSFVSQISLIPGIRAVQIAAGVEHSLILSDTFQVYSFGRNNYGQLGRANLSSDAVPRLIFSLLHTNISLIRASPIFSYVMTQNHSILSLGLNFRGQLGINDYNSTISLPTVISPPITSNLYRIMDIQVGLLHAVLISNRWCFGKRFSDTLVCSGHGKCVKRDTCECDVDWYGSTCNITKCKDVFSNQTNVCSSRGLCVDRICRCRPVPPSNDTGIFSGLYGIDGWVGDDCETARCNSIIFMGAACDDLTFSLAHRQLVP